MFRISHIILISFILFISTVAVSAQAAISEEKRVLISELVTIFKMDRQMLEITDGILKEMQNTYPVSFAAAIDARNDLSEVQKEKLKASSTESFRAFTGKFRKRLAETVDYGKYIQEVVYPLYDQFYSETELKDLLVFYRSPTGQKVIESLPRLLEASQLLAREKLLPKILPIITEIVQEEFQKSGPPRPAKRPGN